MQSLLPDHPFENSLAARMDVHMLDGHLLPDLAAMAVEDWLNRIGRCGVTVSAIACA